MIREDHGNLLRAEVDALVNTVNTVGVMGKGIALQFKRAYPEMFRAYERAAKSGELQLGEMFVWETGVLDGPRLVINFPTKGHWRSPSRIADIENGLRDLVDVIERYQVRSIAVPPLGCGHGGLNWDEVAPLIWRALGPISDTVDVLVYPPDGAPPAADMIDRTPRPRMSSARAAVVKLLRAYENSSLRGTTPIEVQKLAYFLQLAGENLRLDFTKGAYGPYADSLRKTLREIEGHFITGFGDGSAKVLEAEPLYVIEQAADQADAILADDSTTAERVDRVIALTEGFTSMYGLELLATAHWAATHCDPPTQAEITRVVQSWNERKSRIFTPEHIGAALAQLDEQGWLSVS